MMLGEEKERGVHPHIQLSSEGGGGDWRGTGDTQRGTTHLTAPANIHYPSVKFTGIYLHPIL